MVENDPKYQEECLNQVYNYHKLSLIGQLSSSIIHELNNPLAIIQLNLDDVIEYLKEKQLLDDFLAQKFNKQEENINKITHQIRSLRAYVKQNNEIVTVNLHQLITSTLLLIEPIFKKENIVIESSFYTDLKSIQLNLSDFQELFLSILMLFKKASISEEKQTIKIKTCCEENKLNITFSGINLSTDRDISVNKDSTDYSYKKVFKDYFTEISIIKKLTTALNGILILKEDYYKNTILTITLPTSLSDLTILDNTNKKEPKTIMTGNILVVDDEVDMLQIIKRCLQKFGFDVDVASSGQEGLKLLKEKTYKFLLTDLKMPGMTGENLIKKARDLKLLENTKILIITGGLIDEFADNKGISVREKVDGIIQKPFTKEEIYNKIKQIYD